MSHSCSFLNFTSCSSSLPLSFYPRASCRNLDSSLSFAFFLALMLSENPLLKGFFLVAQALPLAWAWVNHALSFFFFFLSGGGSSFLKTTKYWILSKGNLQLPCSLPVTWTRRRSSFECWGGDVSAACAKLVPFRRYLVEVAGYKSTWALRMFST